MSHDIILFNGSGKSTVIKTIAGIIPPISGKLRIGSGVKIGYIAQDTRQNDTATISDILLKYAPDPSMAFTIMKQFNFHYADRNKRYSDLSPGERTRVLLARFALSGVNVLLLDEPTNHLDLNAIEALESLLIGFAGSIILASHDRTLIEHLNISKQITL